MPRESTPAAARFPGSIGAPSASLGAGPTGTENHSMPFIFVASPTVEVELAKRASARTGESDEQKALDRARRYRERDEPYVAGTWVEFRYNFLGSDDDDFDLSDFINLDEVDFSPILAGIEPILEKARLLADWAGDRPLDEASADMLLRIAAKWLKLERYLNPIGIGGSPKWVYDEDSAFAAAICLHELARQVRENNPWFKYVPTMLPVSLLELDPEAVMGMPHATFAKRLAVAAELLRKAVSAKETSDAGRRVQRSEEHEGNREQGADSEISPRKRMTRDEANAKAMQLAEADHDFVNKTQREWAREIGCSEGLITDLPFWRRVAEKTGRDRKGRAQRRASSIYRTSCWPTRPIRKPTIRKRPR
jgi:hypothetical protein